MVYSKKDTNIVHNKCKITCIPLCTSPILFQSCSFTDSAYMALSAPLENIIKPDLRPQFYREYGNWFPRPYCHDHHEQFIQTKLAGEIWSGGDCCVKQKQYDKRTPGLFKGDY